MGKICLLQAFHIKEVEGSGICPITLFHIPIKPVLYLIGGNKKCYKHYL